MPYGCSTRKLTFIDSQQCTATHTRAHPSFMQGATTWALAQSSFFSAHIPGCTLCGTGRIRSSEADKQARQRYPHRSLFPFCKPLDPLDCAVTKVYADDISRCIASSPLGSTCSNHVIRTFAGSGKWLPSMLTLDEWPNYSGPLRGTTPILPSSGHAHIRWYQRKDPRWNYEHCIHIAASSSPEYTQSRWIIISP